MLKRLKPDHPFLATKNYIGGAWVPASQGFTAPVKFPAASTPHAEPLGHIPNSCGIDAKEAVTAAHNAFPEWSKTLPSKRAALLRAFANRMRYHVDDLAEVIAAESGKVLPEAKGEVLYSATYFDWYAGEAERINGMILPPFKEGIRPLVLKKPVGVVSIITPWNFPCAMIARGAAGALAAGCTTVIKPSDLTPFGGTALAHIAEEVGLPAGVFNIVQSKNAADIGNTWNNDKRVRKITFTGSTRVGKLLAAHATQTMKKISMELGGNAPFIVFEDADIDRALDAFMSAKFRNSAQTCICPNRLLVHESIKSRFSDALVDRLSKFKLGNSLEDETVTLGPLITQAQRDRVHGLVKNATSAGARLLCGGKCLDSEVGPNFYSPAALDNVKWNMDIYSQEIFGPAIPILSFKTDEEAISMANDVDVGLASYAFTNNHKRLWRLAENLHYGMIGLNESMISSASVPFGGVKESGYNRDGGPTGIESFLDTIYVAKGGIDYSSLL